MRITHQMMSTNTVQRLNERLAAFERSQTRIGTGKRMQRPSDDVAGMGSALRLRAALAARKQEARNAQDGEMWVNVADSKLQTAVAQLQRGRELAVRGAGLSDSMERSAIMQEVTGIRDTLVSIANSRSQGRGIFAGYAGGDAVTMVAGTWTYTGDTGKITRRVSESDVVGINVTGNEVFGFAAGSDVFAVLDDLAAALTAGDKAAISASIDRIDESLDHVLDGLSVLGAASNRLEAAASRNAVERQTVRGYLSEVEDVDIAEAITELQMQEIAYEATLGALSRAMQPSLIDFLR